MKRVTIRLPDEAARWARLRAAQHGQTVSGLVRDLLAVEMSRETTYEAAMRSYLSRAPYVRRLGGG